MRFEAHRGLGAEFFEDVMPSFRGACEFGYDMIEIDPRFTADGHCVILHDPTIAHTGRDWNNHVPEASIAIRDITFAHALDFEFGFWVSPAFKGEKLPELR